MGGIFLLTPLILPTPINFDTDIPVPGTEPETDTTIFRISVLEVGLISSVLAGSLLIGCGIVAIRLSKKN